MRTGSAGTVEPESPANDRWAIHDVLVRYCRGVDRLDADLVRSAYHSDAVEHGPYRYTGEAVGSELQATVSPHTWASERHRRRPHHEHFSVTAP
jgi:hypothetical protein